jgi:hypothetical protein
VLHCFGYIGTPAYHGRLYHEFKHAHCKVHVDILTNPSDPSRFTKAMGDDLDDTVERAVHKALTEFCEGHLPGLDGTTVALFPIRNEGNAVWSDLLAAVGDAERLTYHAGWTFTTRYAQHMSSMLQEVTATGAHQCLHLEKYDDQIKANNRLIKDIQKGNRELLQQNHCLETHVKELNDELMRMYHSHNVKTNFLDDAHTWLQHTQDELTVSQNYVCHLEAELHERDEHHTVSQAQAVQLQDVVKHLQELLPPDDEPEEDPEEGEGLSEVEDN